MDFAYSPRVTEQPIASPEPPRESLLTRLRKSPVTFVFLAIDVAVFLSAEMTGNAMPPCTKLFFAIPSNASSLKN